MGACRSCDARCHNARRERCDCWCGGHFHGAAGAQNRELFLQAFQLRQLPTTHAEYERVLQQPRLALGGKCRVCGCTDAQACVDEAGNTCWWAEPGLCSSCVVLEALQEVSAMGRQ